MLCIFSLFLTRDKYDANFFLFIQVLLRIIIIIIIITIIIIIIILL